jgi:hypothetical protein
MREIMHKLDEVARAAQELRERVQQEMDAAQHRDAPAGDDPDVTNARKTSRSRGGRASRPGPGGTGEADRA